MDEIKNVVIFEGNTLLALAFEAIYQGNLMRCLEENEHQRKIVTGEDFEKYNSILSKQYIKKTKKLMGVNYGYDSNQDTYSSDLFEIVRLNDGRIGYTLRNDTISIKKVESIVHRLLNSYYDVVSETASIFRTYYQHSCVDRSPSIKKFSKTKRLFLNLIHDKKA